MGKLSIPEEFISKTNILFIGTKAKSMINCFKRLSWKDEFGAC
jgi:hypothetical protein